MNHLFNNSVSVRRAGVAKAAATGEMLSEWRAVSTLSGVSCRISPASGRRMIAVGKKQVVSSHTMFTDGEEAFLEGDLLTDESKNIYEILLVRVCAGFNSYHHTELDLVYRSGQEAL